MEFKFNNTIWEEIKDGHQLIVSADCGLGLSIRLMVALDDKILLQLNIKNKEDLITFWELMHIAGVMESKGKVIENVDRICFVSGLKKIGELFQPDSELANNTKADQYARQMQKYGRDLWELLGKSNLMFLL